MPTWRANRLQNWRLLLLLPLAPDDPAIKELDTKIRLNPADTVAYYKRGQLHAQRGDYARAVKDFDEVLRLNPGTPRRSTTAAGRAP